jgi:hypothetical protein
MPGCQPKIRAFDRDTEFALTTVQLRGIGERRRVPELIEPIRGAGSAGLEPLPHRVCRALEWAFLVEHNVYGHLREEIGHLFLVLKRGDKAPVL